MGDPEFKLHPPLTAADRALLERLERSAERLAGRVSFILGVVTGANRRALGSKEAHGEPLVCGSGVTPFRLPPPSPRLTLPLAAVQRAGAEPWWRWRGPRPPAMRRRRRPSTS